MIDSITLAMLLTAAGAGIAAAIVTLFVDVIKVPFPTISGIQATFVASLVLYALVFVDGGIFTIEAAFEAGLAWLFCAAAAFGLHSTLLAPVSARIGTLERRE